MLRRWLLVLVALVSALSVVTPVAARPAPDPDAGPCGVHVGKWHVVEWYHSTYDGRVPLRCGRWSDGSGWGYRKAVVLGRWNTWYDGMIGATLEGPKRVEQGSARVYRTDWFVYCNPEYRFKVVLETRKAGHKHMMGIITAHKEFE